MNLPKPLKSTVGRERSSRFVALEKGTGHLSGEWYSGVAEEMVKAQKSNLGMLHLSSTRPS
jgi:hypothetical protein